MPSAWPQTNTHPNAAAPATEEGSGKSLEVQFSPQQLQEQLQQLLKAIDRVREDAAVNLQRSAAAVDFIRRDTEVSLQRYAAAVDVKLDLFNQAFVAARERELQAVHSSNRFALTTASIMVAVLLLEILFLAWISVRSVNRLAARMSAWLAEHSPEAPLLGANAAHLLTGNMIEQTNLRLQKAIARLEQRFLDLEHAANRFPAPANRPVESGTSNTQANSKLTPPKSAKAPGVSLSLGEGESLIFLPHDQKVPPLRTHRNILQKLRKKFLLARIAKSH
jgi:hypothetical protein